MKTASILIVEDEAAIRDMIQFALANTRFALLAAEDCRQAEILLHEQTPNLILLDWMLPNQSGIDFIQWLKAKPLYQDIPIIMLTAKAEEEYKIRGLNAGADDYVLKPFSPKELIARIEAVLRRGTLLTPEQTLEFKQIILDTSNHTISVDKQPLQLTPNEFELLEFFLRHRDRTYTREQLISSIWGHTQYIDDRTVDAQIRRLRNKLKPFNYHQHIETIRGTGYRFSSENINHDAT